MSKSKGLKILVVEDKPENIGAAKEMLKEHTLTIVSGFDQAVTEIKRSSGFYRIGNENIESFDVVLTDLMFPKGGNACMARDDEKYLTEEMPYGSIVVFHAIEAGVKNIGLITQGNHHADPFVYALDNLRGFKSEKTSVVITNYCDAKGVTKVKDWAKLLKMVLGTLDEVSELSGLPIARERRSI